MRPVLFEIGGVAIHSYGFMLAIAFIVGTLLARSEARRKGIDPDIVFDLVLASAVGGIIGARLFYVIGHYQEFLQKPLLAMAVWRPGLIFYGGLLGGAIAVLILVRIKRLFVWDIADILSPSLALGYAIARIGCFLNGCCYGSPCDLPWAVNFFDVSRHPTQIYSFIYSLAIFGILWSLRKRISKPGILFWLYLGLYSIARFAVEFFRTSQRVVLGLSAAQIISIIVCVMSAIVIFIGLSAKGSSGDKQ